MSKGGFVKPNPESCLYFDVAVFFNEGDKISICHKGV